MVTDGAVTLAIEVHVRELEAAGPWILVADSFFAAVQRLLSGPLA